jgi:Rab-GTPase-TBC domain
VKSATTAREKTMTEVYDRPPLKSCITHAKLKEKLRKNQAADLGDIQYNPILYLSNTHIYTLGPRVYIWSELTSYSDDSSTDFECERLLRLNRMQFAATGDDEKENASNDDLPGSVEEILALLRDTYHDFEEVALLRHLLRLLYDAALPCAAVYAIGADIIRNSVWYLSIGAQAYHANLSAFREILMGRLPKTAEKLIQLGALEDVYLNEFFIYFYSNILRKDHVNRIVEMFLLEGRKVLYRFSIALFSYFKRDIKSTTVRSAEQLYLHIQTKAQADSFDFDIFFALAFGKGTKKEVFTELGILYFPVDPYSNSNHNLTLNQI